MLKNLLILSLAGIFVFLISNSVFSQQETESEYQWIWGEVVSVDTQNKIIKIKYLDYETDTEKEISFAVDDKTTYEGVNSLLEIKPQDTISVDYVTEADKNIARNISVEKPESAVTEASPAKTGTVKP